MRQMSLIQRLGGLMAKAKFYQVYLKPKNGIGAVDIEKKMNLALDWFKYDNSNWILYSNSSIEKLMARLKPLCDPDGRLFICELTIENRNGWMSKDFWAWLKKTRPSKALNK